MENMIKGIKNLGNKKYLVKIYINETLYNEKELTYFELATILLTQYFFKLEIRMVD